MLTVVLATAAATLVIVVVVVVAPRAEEEELVVMALALTPVVMRYLLSIAMGGNKQRGGFVCFPSLPATTNDDASQPAS